MPLYYLHCYFGSDGQDYVGLNTTFTANSSQQCFDINILDDTLYENPGGESFCIVLRLISGLFGVVMVDFEDTAKVIIFDSDRKL